MNESPELLKWLMYPAYGLFHLDSLEESVRGGYLYDIVPDFDSLFDAAQQQCILAALAWAGDCDALKWQDVLPGLPHSDEFRRQHFRITRDRLLKRIATPSDEPNVQPSGTHNPQSA